MVDEDTMDQETQTPEETPSYARAEDLQSLQAQLAEMNRQYQAGMQSMVDAVMKSQTKIDSSEDEYLTAEEKQIKALRAEIASIKNEVPKQTQSILQKERELNNKIVALASEFPEIQSDAKIRQAVLDEHNRLPSSLKDSAEGYELAVQRAVTRAGLIAKSKRQSDTMDADSFSSPASKGGSSAKAGAKRRSNVSEATLMFAQLMGRNIDDPKVRAGLESAAERLQTGQFGKYR